MADDRYVLLFPQRVGDKELATFGCKECGAFLIDAPSFDVKAAHDDWHDRMKVVEEHASSFRNHVHNSEDY